MERKSPNLLEEMRHFTDKTLGLGIHPSNCATITTGVHSTYMSVRQKIVTQERCMRKSLNDTVHEARVTQVDQATKTYT